MRTHKEARNGIGRTVLSTMPVVASSRHTVVSEWGYGEAGLLKLAKTYSFAWHGIFLQHPRDHPYRFRIKVDGDYV